MSIWVYPALGALLGWGSQYLWYLILFSPVTALHLGPCKWEGLLSRRLRKLSEFLPEYLGEHLLNPDTLGARLSAPERIEKMLPFIEAKIDSFLREGLPKTMPVFSMFIGDSTVAKIRGVFVEELRRILPDLIQRQISGSELKAELAHWMRQQLEDPTRRIWVLRSIKNLVRPVFQVIQWIGLVSGWLAGMLSLAAFWQLH